MCPSKLPAEKRTNAPEKAFECGKRMIPSTNPHARPLKGLHKGPFFSRMMFGAGHFSQSQCWCFRDKMRWCFVFWPQPLHDTSWTGFLIFLYTWHESYMVYSTFLWSVCVVPRTSIAIQGASPEERATWMLAGAWFDHGNPLGPPWWKWVHIKSRQWSDQMIWWPWMVAAQQPKNVSEFNIVCIALNSTLS